MEETLNYNEVFQFMRDFGVDFLNRYEELIIDEPTNTYVCIKNCKNIEDVKLYVVFSLCRPIGKGLEDKPATRILGRFNKYFNTNLTREDMRLMYGELCYETKLDHFKDFIRRGFPMEELKKASV
jgi:hypothetical protein